MRFQKTETLLGQGASGKVYLCTCEGRMGDYAGKYFTGKNAKHDFRHEFQSLCLTQNCPYVIKMEGFDDKKLVIYFKRYNSLFHYMKDPNGIFSSTNGDPNEISEFCKKIYECMISLAQIGCIHGDIKLSNILVDFLDNSKRRPIPIISDLAYCSRVGSNVYTGSFEYMTPENRNDILQRRHIRKPNCFETDAYALGVLTSFLFINYPEYFFTFIRPVVNGLSNYDPYSRITINRALNCLNTGQPLTNEDIDAPFRFSSYENENISSYFQRLLSRQGPFYHVYNPALGKYYGYCIFHYEKHIYIAINFQHIKEKIETINQTRLKSTFHINIPYDTNNSIHPSSTFLYTAFMIDHAISRDEIQNYLIYLQN